MADIAISQNGVKNEKINTEDSLLISKVGFLSHQYLLLLRFIVINATAVALFTAIWLQGWIDPLIADDLTRLITIISVLFAVGLVICTRRILQTSLELNSLSLVSPKPGSRVETYLERARLLDSVGRQNLASSFRLKLSSKISVVKNIANSLVLLGLIGTVLGFIIALSGVEPDSVGDTAAIAPMVSTLISGMSVALYTTLVGSVLNVWLMMNYRILESGTVQVLTQLMDRAETGHARS